jgi:FkbH-like protein
MANAGAAAPMTLADALRLTSSPPPAKGGRTRVALACGFTPMHLQTFLRAQLRLLHPDRHVDVVTGLYDDVAGTLRTFAEDRFDAVALVLEWPDIDPRLGLRRLGGWSPRTAAEIVERVAPAFAHLERLVLRAAEASPVVVSLPSLPFPPLFFTPGWQASSGELSLRAAVARFAERTSRNPRVRVISEQALDAVSPPAERLDVKTTWMSGFPYRPAHASALAELIARGIRNALPRKGLITDLDNTLWRGIVGDDGPGSVAWDLEHQAQGHGVYQQFLAALAEEGVLVGAASKNDPAVVDEAFRREDLLLRRDRLFPLAVSWGSKAHAVRQVLDAWNVDADSVVFVDDNPIELAEVKAAHPRIECVLFPARDPRGIYDLILRLRDLFGRTALSEEDALRLESLRRRAEQPVDAASVEGYSEATLREANGEIVLEMQGDPHDARALELLNKTNQFNLNGRRFTEREWAEYLADPRSFVLTASYRDRYGALGKIAVMAGRAEGRRVDVEAWVMSCRAFARRIEHHCLTHLFERFSAEEVTFAYAETARNGPLTTFLTAMMGGPPARRAALTAPAFAAACPELLHRVVLKDERRHERYADAAR